MNAQSGVAIYLHILILLVETSGISQTAIDLLWNRLIYLPGDYVGHLQQSVVSYLIMLVVYFNVYTVRGEGGKEFTCALELMEILSES
jgi:hypothetical protein